MSGLGDWLNSKIASVTGKTLQQHADTVKSALALPPPLVTDSASSKMLNAPQPAGTTMTGGRRHRKQKTRKGGKRHRGTRRH